MSGSVFSALSLLFAPKQAVFDPACGDTRLGDAAFTRIGGAPVSLSAMTGKTVLVVNTASRCGFRAQFADLQSLHSDLGTRGLVVLAVPSNDFGRQEPCDDEIVHDIYRSELNITIPLTEKVAVRGQEMHPFFQQIAKVAGKHAVPKWNFYKYVIAPNGNLAGWFSTPIRVRSPRIRSVIEDCLEMQAAERLVHS
ncbi:MAG: glutathione peroxidase [Hyphomicrobiaceae bacterium]|nr:glutathione peroxidase [Hyphomicrobiaceae bacterium]